MSRPEKLLTVSNLLLANKKDHPLRIGIDGIDASGKTIFANELSKTLREKGQTVIRSSIDGFHNPKAHRYRKGRENPEGYLRDSFNTQAILDNILKPLGPNGTKKYREATFDYRTDKPVETPQKTAPNDSILLFDGVFLSCPELRNEWDYLIYLEITYEESVRRGVERDGGDNKQVEKMYRTKYVLGQQLYHQESKPKECADMIIDNNDPLNPKIVKGLGET